MALTEKILVLDFGSQYTHLLARRIRQLGVYSEIMLPTASEKELCEAKGIILSGGPASVYDSGAPEFNPKIFRQKMPILGLCYGHQLMAQELEGKVKAGTVKEYGLAELDVREKKGLFAGLGEKETVWMSHGDTVTEMPKGFKAIGSTVDCPFAAMANDEAKNYGLQFHPEVTHTKNGMKVLENFALKICGCEKNWKMKNFLEEKLAEIEKKAEGKNVFMLASGGVDSTVALALLGKALKDSRVVALHVDTGFMRKNESKEVEKALKKFGIRLHVVDASKEFFERLSGITEPEEKRKIIGELFIEIANRELQRLELKADEWLLGQGTIYPDTIESAGTKNAEKIKTHHNRVESIKQLMEEGKIIEPLNELYKDEVRELGKKLGLSKALIDRHPFPGPGLAIRALCAKKGEANEVKLNEIEMLADRLAGKAGFEAHALPVKGVGVQGDGRTYRNAVALTGELDWKKIEEVSVRLTNELKEINRVLFACYPAKISSIELLEATLAKERIELLRQADAIVMESLQEFGIYNEIWQCPTVLLPLKVNGAQGEAIVLRPVESTEAMTASFYKMQKTHLDKLVKRLMELNGINAVFYDCTNKPPATIEWE
ncbi:MAG: glutamine-hydrolyzing GMP synthase [Candidatus Diapherotrites archaeon]